MKARRKSKELATWDEHLAAQAEIAAKAEASTGGGQFFSTAGRTLTWDGAELENNEMVVIILASIHENVYYEVRYDPDNPAPPVCFAFAPTQDELQPHESVVEAGQNQSDICANCKHNEWGSAEIGKGKACRNTRRLALISAGEFGKNGELEFIENPGHYESGEVGYLKLPVTSIKGYGNFVKQVAGSLFRPLHGIFTLVKVVPDSKTQFKVTFKALGKCPDEIMGAVMKRHEEVSAAIDFPYSLEFEEDEKPKSRSRKKSRY